MSLSPESLQVCLVIKDLLKKSGQQQKDLAKALGVSLPTVKRVLNGNELGFERLVQIARFFNLSVYELFELCRQKGADVFAFSEAQERFLAKELIHLLVFRALLRGFSPAEIKRQYQLKDSAFDKILIGLDKVGLVEFWSSDKIKLKAKWPFKWIEGGVLQKTYMYRFLEKIFSESYRRSKLSSTGKFDDNLFRPFEMVLQESTHRQFRQDIVQLLESYRSLSRLEMMVEKPEKLHDVSGLLISDSFSAWEIMQR